MRSSSPTKGTAAPPPASSIKPPSGPSGKKFSRKVAKVSTEKLSGAFKASVVQPTNTQALTLHVGHVAIAAGEGRIIELNRGDANLGALQRYVDKWNLSDLTEATLGAAKTRRW